jgi:hypothetical protein
VHSSRAPTDRPDGRSTAVARTGRGAGAGPGERAQRADLMMLKGTLHGGFGGIGFPGARMGGEMVEVGSAVENWRVGDRVMAAGLAGFANTPSDMPDGCTPSRRACPSSKPHAAGRLQTMHDASSQRHARRRSEVLIQGPVRHGPDGLQVAKLLGAGRYVGTSPAARGWRSSGGRSSTAAPDWVRRCSTRPAGRGGSLIDLVAGR